MHVNHAPNRLQLDAFDGWTLSGLVRAKPHAQPGTRSDLRRCVARGVRLFQRFCFCVRLTLSHAQRRTQ